MKSRSPVEVLQASLQLGLTSFGGPIAHLGYFNREYVQKRRWLSAEEYAAFVSLCQLLPGPTSSQVGFLIGLHRAGIVGALAAWVGFTLPSAVLLYAFAIFAPHTPGPLMQALLHGLTLTAVTVVSEALWSMARSLCPDWQRAAIALGAAALLAMNSSTLLQFLALAGGAIAGSIACRKVRYAGIELPAVAHRRTAWIGLAIFCTLLLALPVWSAFAPHGPIALASLFYRAGALVFGGGHVVLPLLQDALVPGRWLTNEGFLAGMVLPRRCPGPCSRSRRISVRQARPRGSPCCGPSLPCWRFFCPGCS